MNNAAAITVTLDNGIVINYGPAVDKRIIDTDLGANLLICRSDKAAYEINCEMAAWGIRTEQAVAVSKQEIQRTLSR